MSMEWMNEPPEWGDEDGKITVKTAENSSFWNRTYFDRVSASGHFYFDRIEGDFEARCTVAGHFDHKYDQAGLMVRLADDHWIKAGIEFQFGRQYLSSVVTREASDWSMQSFSPHDHLWMKLSRIGPDFLVEYSTNGILFHPLRLARLGDHAEAQIGLMCCSPTRAGLSVTFEHFEVTKATESWQV